MRCTIYQKKDMNTQVSIRRLWEFFQSSSAKSRYYNILQKRTTNTITIKYIRRQNVKSALNKFLPLFSKVSASASA